MYSCWICMNCTPIYVCIKYNISTSTTINYDVISSNFVSSIYLRKYFFDIKNHRKASTSVNTWSMYCALGYSGFRKLKLSKSNYISSIAYLFSIFVMICHIPRLLKQKFFPGLGKQNYT